MISHWALSGNKISAAGESLWYYNPYNWNSQFTFQPVGEYTLTGLYSTVINTYHVVCSDIINRKEVC